MPIRDASPLWQLWVYKHMASKLPGMLHLLPARLVAHTHLQKSWPHVGSLRFDWLRRTSCPRLISQSPIWSSAMALACQDVDDYQGVNAVESSECRLIYTILLVTNTWSTLSVSQLGSCPEGGSTKSFVLAKCYGTIAWRYTKIERFNIDWKHMNLNRQSNEYLQICWNETPSVASQKRHTQPQLVSTFLKSRPQRMSKSHTCVCGWCACVLE